MINIVTSLYCPADELLASISILFCGTIQSPESHLAALMIFVEHFYERKHYKEGEKLWVRDGETKVIYIVL